MMKPILPRTVTTGVPRGRTQLPKPPAYKAVKGTSNKQLKARSKAYRQDVKQYRKVSRVARKNAIIVDQPELKMKHDTIRQLGAQASTVLSQGIAGQTANDLANNKKYNTSDAISQNVAGGIENKGYEDNYSNNNGLVGPVSKRFKYSDSEREEA